MSVVVLGGGVTGLAAAGALRARGIEVTLVEPGARLGGKVETERVDGFLVERGPDAVLAQHPAIRGLDADALALVPPREPHGVFVWHRDRLIPLPEGLGFGIPTRLLPFAMSPLFSPREKLRAALDVVLPAGGTDGDEAVGALLRRRLGDAVVDRLAGPLIGGVYGASVDELSLLALMPRLRDAERGHRSLVLAGLAARRRGAPAAGSSVMAPLRGMGAVVDALTARAAGADVRLGARAVRLARERPGYAVSLDDGSRIRADAVIVATPAPVAASLLEELAPQAIPPLRSVAYRGTAAVSIGYAASQLEAPARGHGFVAPDGALAMAACTWTSEKWPARAPDGAVLVRATVRDERVLAGDDSALIERVQTDLARTMRVQGRPVMARVARWTAAMPRYTVGHLERVAAAEAALASQPRVVLAGAAYRGSGVADCIAQGLAAAERVLASEAAAA